MADPTLDQAVAAVAETRHMVSKALNIDAGRTTHQGSSPWFEELWAIYGTASRCQHLVERPVQPALMCAPIAVWRCRPCMLAWTDDRRARGVTFDPIEEWTCDRCRRYTPTQLIPMIIRQDLWLIMVSLCGDCQSAALDAGAKLLGSEGDK